MNRLRILVPATCALALLAWAAPGHAGFADALKKKMAEKATKKAEAAVDKATEKPGQSAEPAEAEKAAGAAAAPTGAGAKVSAVSTKFDYVPGDAVLFVDDFRQDELGEFPARWTLSIGTFETAEMDGERWLRCMSPDGTIRPKLPAMEKLPEFWTLEFDFYGAEPLASALTVRGVGENDQTAWEATWPNGTSLSFRSGEIFSSTPLEGVTTAAGRRHVMLMARGTSLKVYIDNQRLANVPDVTARAGLPKLLEFRLWANVQPMITNVRFAEGCRPAKDMLDTGKLVTYGIRFPTGSDVVLPESAPVLRQVAAYMTARPDVKLRISGHTDNVGTPASNLDLSRRRAASVAKVLSADFGIASERFATDGKGDTQAVASNAKPEGRAMNRRVEFAKLQ
jgi:OOP family OmpA-OmpF porin